MAVDIWNELTVTRSDKFLITVEGEGEKEIPLDKSNLVVVGLEAAFKKAGKPVPLVHYHLTQRVPHARGLGSSSAAIVAGVLAGLVLAGHTLDIQGK
jgi:homoserine kinase